MNSTEQSVFEAYLLSREESEWSQVLKHLLPSVHPVDQEATQLWFAFWPLKLTRLLRESQDSEETARRFLLGGRFLLAEVLDASVEFLYGSRYWREVKQGVLKHAERATGFEVTALEEQILDCAGQLSRDLAVPLSHLVGVTAVGFLALAHLGTDSFEQLASTPSTRAGGFESPEEILRKRTRRPLRWLSFLKTVDREHRVTFDENRPGCSFDAIEGQDLTMAATRHPKDWKGIDPRRVEGPLPTQCRSGACGTCWVGVLSGRENLSEISAFERRRLKYFGYVGSEADAETHPLIRLGCQAVCRGDVTIVIPPWNGQLEGRR